jgi:D-3-phosphoglycerate dehydrogenase
MMPKVLVVQPIHDDGMALLRARPDVEVEVLNSTDAAEIAARIADADAVTMRTALLPAPIIERATRLKVVARHGVGYDNIDVAALTARGIPLTITADANATAVAEQTLFLMLALAKQALPYDRATRQGGWAIRSDPTARDLLGKRLLIMGFGRIGREVATRARAFDMRVAVYDPYVEAGAIREAGYEPVTDLDTALGATDVLSLHLPGGADHRHLIGSKELAALPSSAIVINCARGGIIDEAALHEALTSGQIAGAGLDVFEVEPPPVDHPLFALDNVVLSPHVAGLSKEAAIRMAVSTARSALAGIDGTIDPSMVVNREVLGAPIVRISA